MVLLSSEDQLTLALLREVVVVVVVGVVPGRVPGRRRRLPRRTRPPLRHYSAADVSVERRSSTTMLRENGLENQMLHRMPSHVLQSL